MEKLKNNPRNWLYPKNNFYVVVVILRKSWKREETGYIKLLKIWKSSLTEIGEKKQSVTSKRLKRYASEVSSIFYPRPFLQRWK